MNKRMGLIGALVLVATLTSMLVSCTSSAPTAPAAIEIGAVVPITGKYAALGGQIKAGYDFAVADINKAGGVYVKQYDKKLPLKLTLLDDGSDPANTVQRLETLDSADKVVAYLGGGGSDLHAAAAAIAEKNKIPYLGIAFALESIHEKGYKYLFSPFPKSPDLAKNAFDILNTLPKDQRPTKFAIFEEKTDWGAEMSGYWKQDAAKMGYNIVLDEQYAPGSKDFSDMILKAKAAGVDAVLSLPNPPDGIAIIKQMKELGLNPKYINMHRAPDGPTWAQALGSAGDYVIGTAGWHDAATFPLVKQLNTEYQAKFGRPADVLAGPAYSLVQITADAINRAGTLDHQAIRDAIAKTNMMTVEGPVTFRSDGTGTNPVISYQWQNGKQELIWPKSMASKPLAYPAKPFNER